MILHFKIIVTYINLVYKKKYNSTLVDTIPLIGT